MKIKSNSWGFYGMVKIRSEKSGLHFFNRKNGLHILFDEIQVLAKDCSIAPRHLSVALTELLAFL